MSSQFNYTLETFSSAGGYPAELELSTKRRSKQTVPDTAKDDKYWERRKRNNLSAKRSRELKRLAEKSTKERVVGLYEENAVLKFELSILKRRLGLPEDKSILSETEREAVVNDLRKGGVGDLRYVSLDTNSPDDNSSRISAHSNSTGTSSFEEMDDEFPLHPDIKPSNLPAHVAFLNSDGVYTTGYHVNANVDLKRNVFGVNIDNQNNKRKAYSEGNYTPTDLSTKKRKPAYAGHISSLNEMAATADGKTKDVVDLNIEHETEIRTKLQFLSDQVQKMQKLVSGD